MTHLSNKQRKIRGHKARWKPVIDQRRADGHDVVSYALRHRLCRRYLTPAEKADFDRRRAVITERKRQRRAEQAALSDPELRLHDEAFRVWKDWGAGGEPWHIGVDDVRVMDAARRNCERWGDHEAAKFWTDTGSHTPDDAHERFPAFVARA